MKIKDIERSYYDDNGMIKAGHFEKRRLHKAFGIDWTKPYLEIEHHGKFTIRSLEKEIESYGYTPLKCLVLAIVRGQEPWDEDRWRVTRIIHGDFEVDMPYVLDEFYRKYEFDDARKKDTCDAIFFAQETENLTPCKFTRCSYGHGYTHISEPIDLYGRFNKPEDTHIYNAILDHSGYCLNRYRDDLQKKLEIYKADKAKREYLSTDNTDKIVTLERLIEKYKKKLSESILSIQTRKDVDAIRDLIGWNGLEDIVSTFERFKTNTLDRSYKSIDDSNYDYDRVAKKCYAYID